MAPGKYSYRFTLENQDGQAAEPLFVPVWLEKTPFDWRDALIYFVFTDRFANGDKGNDRPHRHRQAGRLAGRRLRRTFWPSSKAATSTGWASTRSGSARPTMNTQKAWPGSDGHSYAGYHSYWPISIGWTDEQPISGLSAPFEPHFGSVAEFKAIVAEAHARGMRVLVDFVANHVHEDSPLYTQHKNDSPAWFNWDNGRTGQAYVCGWDRPIELLVRQLPAGLRLQKPGRDEDRHGQRPLADRGNQHRRLPSGCGETHGTRFLKHPARRDRTPDRHHARHPLLHGRRNLHRRRRRRTPDDQVLPGAKPAGRTIRLPALPTR